MKIVLLGKNGMLGSAFLSKLSSLEENNLVYAFSRKELDVLDSGKLQDMISSISPDVLINCVAHTNVIKAESEEKSLCLNLNVEFIKRLSDFLLKKNSTLIHFSSDYVFDGEKGDFYDEDDAVNPLNFYGYSKVLGEKAIQDIGVKHAIIRTAWLYGPKGQNFVDKMIDLSKEKEFLKIVDDKFGSPTYTLDLASSVISNFLNHDNLSGIFHLVNEGVISRYKLVEAVKEFKGIKTLIIPCSSEEFPSPAVLPRFSPLRNNKVLKLRSIKDALKAYLH